LLYQFASGFIQLLSHGRLTTNLASEGVDMIADGARRRWASMWVQSAEGRQNEVVVEAGAAGEFGANESWADQKGRRDEFLSSFSFPCLCLACTGSAN